MKEVLLMIFITFIDEPQRTFIDLPDDIVKLLDVQETSTYDQLETQLDKLTDTGKPNHPTPGLSETIEDTSDNASDTPENKSSNVNNSNAAGVTLSDESFSLSDYEGYLNQHGFSDDAEDDYNDDLDVGDDNEDLHDSSDMNLERFTDNDKTDVNDVQDDDDAISHNFERRRRFRFKRDAGYQQWRHSLPGHQIKQKHEEDIVWEEVTDVDLQRAKYGEVTRTAKYVGMTLLSVTCFVFIGYYFIRDPVAFVFAFGTGCPCCIICCPCIRKFTDKYLNVKKIIRDSMNRYMPGMIINDDGSFETYEPTGEELAIMEEILDEIMD